VSRLRASAGTIALVALLVGFLVGFLDAVLAMAPVVHRTGGGGEEEAPALPHFSPTLDVTGRDGP
jgi:hypothetical protein